MAFCINCGQQLVDGAKFCANCGTAVKGTDNAANCVDENADVEIGISVLLNNNNAQEFTEKDIYLEHNHKTLAVSIPNGISVGQRIRLRGMGKTTRSGKVGNLFIRIDHIDYKKSAEQQTPRKVVYDGEMHKCPNCGEVINSFVFICPSCGHELRGANTSNIVKEFSIKLLHSESENQKINLIRSFPIPNTKEDIFEFMILASSNFDPAYYVAHMNEDDISDAWLTKIEQCYKKAEITFNDSSDFQKIKSTYINIKNDIAEYQRRYSNAYHKHKQDQEYEKEKNIFKKSKQRIVLIIFMIISALCCAVAFNDDEILAGVIAVIMFILFMLTFLMGSGVIKEKVKNIRLIPMILSFVLFIPYFSAYNGDLYLPDLPEEKEIVTIVWDDLYLGDKAPDFSMSEGEILWNYETGFKLKFYNIENSVFSSYKTECKNFGYTIEKEEDDRSFKAYNAEGYDLYLWYDKEEKYISIDVEEPTKRNTISWPNSNLVKDLPVPKSLIGEVSTERDTSYWVYIVDADMSYYLEYVASCMANGFNVDYWKTDTYFSAKNKSGISLTVEYIGFNTIEIWIRE